ncbi:flavoprotein [Micromonospora sp. NPDC050397]|uniref:flavoprotein n=1 Tax=Micromonospora sp. NPDC050397 TaxID=3364279 RepID=UPI00384AAC85
MSEQSDPVVASPRARLLVGASGSMSVTMLPPYLTALHAELAETMTVVMTHSARRFLPAHTVGLLADRVVTGDDPADWPTDNQASLAAGHDIVIVLPATANMLAAAATGAAPNLLAGVILAATCPVVFFPVMSASMWAKPSVARNIEQLRADGHHVVDPAWAERYDVASRSVAENPTLPPPPAVVAAVRELLAG